jgi:RepB DNA-primase from phage plasmid
MTNLIHSATVRKFIDLVHQHADDASRDIPDQIPAVLHLCSMSPDDQRFSHSAYDIGDVVRMTQDAICDAEAGKNVYIEPRLIRPGRPHERGGINSTLAVFALVGDGDHDTGKPFVPYVPASAVVETSPGNDQAWYFLDRAIRGDDGRELGRRMRDACGGDHCSGNPVQPYRVPGTLNFPDLKKRARGRVPVPARLLWTSDRVYSHAELLAQWTGAEPPKESPAVHRDPAPLLSERPAFCRSKARALLAADVTGIDRSARFMSAVNYAAMGGMTPEQFEEIAREHPPGCGGKYIDGRDRLREEIVRCFAKAFDR